MPLGDLGLFARLPSPLEDGSRLSGATGHLLPERMQMAELIWIQRLGRNFALSTSLYEYRMRDMIDQASDSTTPLGYINQERVKARGAVSRIERRRETVPASWAGYGL